MKHITSAEFDQEVKMSPTPVLVDFYADWCGPCKMLSPVLEEIEHDYEGKVEFIKVNVDSEMSLASKFGVMSIPTVILFKNGQVSDKFVGALPKAQIIAMLNRAL